MFHKRLTWNSRSELNLNILWVNYNLKLIGQNNLRFSQNFGKLSTLKNEVIWKWNINMNVRCNCKRYSTNEISISPSRRWHRRSWPRMASIMGLQQPAASQDTVDYTGYLQSTQCHQIHGSQSNRQIQSSQKSSSNDHNTSFTSTKGLLNGPGQNNCFLNSAVQVRQIFFYDNADTHDWP